MPQFSNNCGKKVDNKMQNWFVYVFIGFAGGILSGLLGIGGGILIIPMLVLMGFPQLTAQGTTLALMVLPIGLWGALEYYKHGHVEVWVGVCIVAGFFIGALFGAKGAMKIPTLWLRRIFGVVMIFAALRLILSK